MRVHVKVLASAVLSGLRYYGIKSLTINPPPGLPRLNARWRNGPPVAYRTRRACSHFGGDSRVMLVMGGVLWPRNTCTSRASRRRQWDRLSP